MKEVWSNGSQGTTLPGFKRLFHLLNKLIQATRFHILFDLLIPRLRLELLEPGGKLRQISRRKLGDGGFYFLYVHARTYEYNIGAGSQIITSLQLEQGVTETLVPCALLLPRSVIVICEPCKTGTGAHLPLRRYGPSRQFFLLNQIKPTQSIEHCDTASFRKVIPTIQWQMVPFYMGKDYPICAL